LKLAVSRSRPPVPYGANFFLVFVVCSRLGHLSVSESYPIAPYLN